MKESKNSSLQLGFLKIFFLDCLLITVSCINNKEYCTVQYFVKVPKIDAQFHHYINNEKYIENRTAVGFKLVSPNVDSGCSIQDQQVISDSIYKSYPDTFAYLSTFLVAEFGTSNFAIGTIRYIDECISNGAIGIKIWKNIDMEMQNY